MMKIESVLQRQLAPIIERRELIHRRRTITAICIVVAVLAFIAWGEARGAVRDPSVWRWFLLPIGGGIALGCVAARGSIACPLRARVGSIR